MTLEEAAFDRRVRVEGFRNLSEREKTHLAGLGIRPGSSITKIIPTPFKDPIECLVGSQLLAVGKRLFKHILVKPLE